MPDPVLTVSGLRKLYGELVAVQDVSFALAPGESLGLVGESGAGKTTVARMILGVERPSAGTIVAYGHDRSLPARSARERRRRARDIQIVFQNPYASLDPRQRIGAALDEVLRLHEPAPSAQRRDRALELTRSVGLQERHLHSLPHDLSGGERQRVAIARALATRPRVLVLDEAVAALDVSIQAQVLNLLADIRESTAIAYVLISHDLAVVRHLTEQIIVMRSGAVVERGSTAQVLEQPQHEYTQSLRASVPGGGWRLPEPTTM